MAILRKLNINGAEYNIGYSQNDLTNELKAKYDASEQNAINASAITISEAAGSGDILKTYTFTQNGAEIGKINLAKDLVVSGGEIVEKDSEKYLSLTIANQETPVEIPVKDLVDVYTGSTYINITNGNVVELKLSDVDAALMAESTQVGAKLKANADAAAAADAKGAQGISDAAAEKSRAESAEAGLRSDLGESGDAAGTGTAFARIKQLETNVTNLSDNVGSQIDSKISAYDTATVQPIANEVEQLQTDVASRVAQSDYDTDMAAVNKSINDNTSAIESNAKDIETMGQKLAGVSDNAKNVTTSYDESTETLTVTIA